MKKQTAEPPIATHTEGMRYSACERVTEHRVSRD